MLEKMGLPPKPSMRGAAWVLDASHCQGCSSQFTFFNRKHHCRRCGGLFCNNCTQQRMFLRGQGDSPVRICDPCKKLEEAVRLETRHGQRNRASKGGSRMAAKSESGILDQILGNDGKSQSQITGECTGYDHLDHQRIADDASSSKPQEGDDTRHSRMRNFSNNSFLESVICGGDEKDSFTPEELRQQAREEKKKYSVLKREGKSEEALQAFKRGKELERRSEALELSLRKSRKNAARERKQECLADPESKVPGTSKDAHEVESSIVENKNKSLKYGREEKDDITSALKELGWSDADLQDADKKPNRMSLEGELSCLVGKTYNSKDGSPGKESVGGASQMEVLAHKRKALALKREGKLAEAKEELKKAKIIEKQLEEQDMIGQEEESDDELAALIRGLAEENIGHPLGRMGEAEESLFNLSQLATMGDECDVNTVEVTDEDINDPEISAALKSVGWTEGADTLEKFNGPFVYSNEQSIDKSVARRTGGDNAANGYFEGGPRSSTQATVDTTCPTHRDRVALQQDIISLKRDALGLKHAGNAAKAMEQLRRAKALEKELQNLESQDSVDSVQLDFDASNLLEKRKPRYGQVGEISHLPDHNASMMMFDEKYEESVEVTDEDMGDPELVRELKDLGWQEGNQAGALGNNSGNLSFLPLHSVNDYSAVPLMQSSKTKAELQRELLGIKRRALALKREGRIEESNEELRKGKLLEQKIEEIESLRQTGNTRSNVLQQVSKSSSEGRGGGLGPLPVQMEEDAEVTEQDLQDPAMLAALRSMGWSDDNDELKRKDSVIPSQVSYSEEFSQTEHKKLELSRQGQRGGNDFRGQKLLRAERVSAIGKIHGREDTSLPLNTRNEQKENCSMESIGLGHGLAETGLDVELLCPHLPLKNKEATHVQAGLPLRAEAQPVNTMDLLTGDNWKPSPSGPGEDLLNYRDGASGTDLPSGTSDIFLGTNVVVQAKATGTPIVSPGQTLQHEKPEQKMRPNAGDTLLGRNETEGNVNTVRNLATFPDQNLPQKMEVHKIKSVIPDSSQILVGTNAFVSNTKVSNSPATLGENVQQESVDHETNSVSSSAGDTLGGTITTGAHANAVVMSTLASPAQNLQEEILSHKRKALALKREGKLADAREELRNAKLLERELELQKNSAGHNGTAFTSSPVVVGVNIPKLTSKAQTTENQIGKGTTNAAASSQTAMQLVPDSDIENVSVSSVGSKTNASMKKQQNSKQALSKNRMKLQQESLAHKRHALALRREGKLAESEAEFELAKSLENQMEELSDNNTQSHLSIGNIGTDDVDLVDSFLDPQLLSALKEIGWKDSDIFSQTLGKGVQGKNKGTVSVSGIATLGNDTLLENANTNEGSTAERSQLEEKIRAEKLRALDLKRAGKQAEALDAFRAAKQLEKKLQSLSP